MILRLIPLNGPSVTDVGEADNCRFKDQSCHKCNQKGHIKPMCPNKGSSTPNRHVQGSSTPNRHVHILNHDEEESDLAHLEVKTVTSGDNALDPPIMVTPTVDGHKITMELDTGSAVSVISEKKYHSIFGRRNWNKTAMSLRTYTGEIVKPLRRVMVQVTYLDQQQKLALYIVRNGGVPLLGRSWLRKIQLDWSTIKSLSLPPSDSPSSALQHVLANHPEVFKEGLGKLKEIKAAITVKEGSRPVFLKSRSVPYALRSKVEAELDHLEKDGILSKVSHSEWATPIVPVLKKNGNISICGDFKATVNPVLNTDQYPLPRAEDIFATLAGGKRFSTIDLAQAYLQMEVEEDSRSYITINTHRGLYRYNRLVFGIASAPAIWQRTMEQVLQGIPGTGVYLDDIIITGSDDQEHLANLDLVLDRLEKFGLHINQSKCAFFQQSVTYCGHVIDANGLHKTQAKVTAVQDAPQPENVSQLRSFIGLVNYYAKFLPGMSTVMHSLHSLLHKGARWEWTTECQKAFKEVKRLIASDCVLTHYYVKLPLKLACDASSYGIGAVMSHQMPDGSERPIQFASRTLTSAERNYAQIEKEALSLVWGVKQFHQYLYGRRFTLITDHQPLITILHPSKSTPAMTAARLQRWALFLGAHTYDIQYRNSESHSKSAITGIKPS